MFIVKIGGSLITDKNCYCTPNPKEIRKYAKIIHENWRALKGKLIIVLGGGSYGNGVPRKYNMSNAKMNWSKQDLLMMTVKMFEWLTFVAEIFREEGVPCYPFQASSYCLTNNGDLHECYVEPIKHCLNMDILPITSGDFTYDINQKFVIYSSDNIPEMFVRNFDVEKVIMLTDVDGIYESFDTKQIYKTVDKHNYKKVLNVAGHSKKQDVTGGMKNKLRALIKIAELGTPCIICNGHDPNMLMKAVNGEEIHSTTIESFS